MRVGRVYALYDIREPGNYRYVGRTVDTVTRRLTRHRRTVASMPHLRVTRWMAKVGPHNVRATVLGEYPEDQLPFWECHWMAALREAGYDLTNIAHGGSAAGFPKGYYRHSPETIAKIRGHAYWRGKKRSEETKRKIGETQRGRKRGPRTDAEKRAISDGVKRALARKAMQPPIS